jgi:hypothetical protein
VDDSAAALGRAGFLAPGGGGKSKLSHSDELGAGSAKPFGPGASETGCWDRAIGGGGGGEDEGEAMGDAGRSGVSGLESSTISNPGCLEGTCCGDRVG